MYTAALLLVCGHTHSMQAHVFVVIWTETKVDQGAYINHILFSLLFLPIGMYVFLMQVWINDIIIIIIINSEPN